MDAVERDANDWDETGERHLHNHLETLLVDYGRKCADRGAAGEAATEWARFMRELKLHCERREANAVAESQSRLEALEEAVRELLPNIEWEGESWGDSACPECGGLMPLLHETDTPHQQRSITRFGVGHRETCALARLRELVPHRESDAEPPR